MKLKKPYKNLDETLCYIKTQIWDSLYFASDWIPLNVNTPDHLFFILKQNTVYKLDPPGVELLQSFPTLMERNYWGIPGAGDCDCFTIAATSCAIVLNMPCKIVLTGREPGRAVHIYNEICGKPFDLTQPYYGSERFYPYKQKIKANG